MPLTETISGAMSGVYQNKPQQTYQTPTEYKLPNPNVKDKLVTEEEWDYKTAELSPDGEPLPAGGGSMSAVELVLPEGHSWVYQPSGDCPFNRAALPALGV